MTNDLYRSSYRHLELSPGSSWQEVRRSYKRLVKRWHPDHFHNDDKTQSVAAEKIKEINRAFDLLAQHYRTHGALPLSGEPPAASDSAGAQGTVHTPPQPAQPAEHTTAEMSGNKQRPPVEHKKHSGAVTRLVLVALMGWFAYALWLAPETPPATHTPTEPSESPGKTDPVIETTDAQQPEAVQPQPFFTYGSTIGDVYAVQGIPTKTADNIWHYGNSKVHFKGGKVTHWEEDPASPLKASADVAANRSVGTNFSIGSTKAQVRAIQGQPLREWANVWEYGMSKVYFDRDRVSGWYDSALNPLLVRK